VAGPGQVRQLQHDRRRQAHRDRDHQPRVGAFRCLQQGPLGTPKVALLWFLTAGASAVPETKFPK
jgi:hypothetical protein